MKADEEMKIILLEQRNSFERILLSKVCRIPTEPL